MRAELPKSMRAVHFETGCWHHGSIWPVLQDGKLLRMTPDSQVCVLGGLEILRAVAFGPGGP